jgi:hypothetical protein
MSILAPALFDAVYTVTLACYLIKVLSKRITYGVATSLEGTPCVMTLTELSLLTSVVVPVSLDHW